MFLQKADIDPAAPIGGCAIRNELALLAASLDTRFLRAGTTLAGAVEVVDRVINGLDGVAQALDERTAGAAVADLRQAADDLTALPAHQAGRADRMGAVAVIARTLNGHVMDMHQTLRVLSIYGMNIKIAASGEEQFVGFVEGMATRLGIGESELAGFILQLKELMLSVAGVQQADRLLATECARVVPEIPEQLASDATALAAYLAAVAALARKVAVIARSVQGKTAVVLGALQVGDSTRQRLEHVVAALQMLETQAGGAPPHPAVADHIHRLLAAQLRGASVDFARETTAMLASLSDLAPEAAGLLDLIDDQSGGGGRDFLTRLERGITDVDRVTGRLGDAQRRSTAMVGVITDTVADLSTRLVSVQRIRVDVQDIATNVRLLCRRHGIVGKAVSVIATEVGIYASKLGATTISVAKAIGDLKEVEASLLDDGGRGADGNRDIGDTLAAALSVIRQACQRTELMTSENGDDTRHLGELLTATAAELTEELSVTDVMGKAADRLLVDAPAAAMTPETDASLRLLLPGIGALYTMAQERLIHADFLLPGMAVAAVASVVEDDDDDGLF